MTEYNLEELRNETLSPASGRMSFVGPYCTAMGATG
jgi:hypothetical protein